MNACPNREKLQQWLADSLSEAESQAIEAHVESCRDVCQPLLDSYSGFEDDGVPDAPPAAAPEMPPEAPAGETPAPQPANFPALPGYEILGELGRGGMGVVFQARHRRMDRLVAIKVLPGNLVQDAAAVSRFEREVKAAARLKHPNIVAAYDAAEAGGVHFLAMEYVEGTDLSAFVRHQGPLSVDRAVDCVLQAAHGLAYAHRHGVVHRDIKPGNLLLDGEGVVKVLDMGLARFETALGADETELTGMNQIMGTVDYMSPEQALDTRHADARADIYALGMTLWYLLIGRSAYVGENALARLLAHREQPIPSLRGACPAASSELEAIFMKMVAKNPDDRYQTMADVIAALEDGLPRPSSKSTPWGDLPRSSRKDEGIPWGDLPGSPREGELGRSPHAVAAQTAPASLAAAPALAATVTFRAAGSDTDPHTEQSLDLLIAALPRKPRGRRKLGIAAALIGLAALAAAAAFVIRVETGEGEIIIESEADGVSVDIVRNGEPVKEDWQIHAGADNRWVVRTGTVEVKLRANLQGELILDPDTARLVRDGKIIVKITRKKLVNVPAVVAEDRDRAVANWVLAQGGAIGYLTSRNVPGWADARQPLPTESFVVKTINLDAIKTVREEDIDRFAQLVGLDNLFLAGSAVGVGAISHIARLERLRMVKLNGTTIKASELVDLAPLRRLSAVTVEAGQLDEESFEALARLSRLRWLKVYGEASSDDLERLGKMPQLRMLYFPTLLNTDRQVTNDIQRVNPFCRILVRQRAKALGRDCVAELANKLISRGVNFKMHRVDSNDEASEADLAAAVPIDISSITIPVGASLDDEEIELLDAPTFLSSFYALRLKGADRHAAALSKQIGLIVINLCQSDLTDAGLEHLKRLPALASLDVQGTKVTRAGVESLQKALPECKILWEPGGSPVVATEDRDRAAAEWVHLPSDKSCTWPPCASTDAIYRAARRLARGSFPIDSRHAGGCVEVSQAFERSQPRPLIATLREDDLDRLANLDARLATDGCAAEVQDCQSFVGFPGCVLSNRSTSGGTRIMTSELPALAGLAAITMPFDLG